MAGSAYEYVRTYEPEDKLLPSTYLVVRLDGKGFTSFSKRHGFQKPNDKRALDLMVAAARRVMEGQELQHECVLAFGESDEFSFVLRRKTKLYGRRASKINTLITSLFTGAYTLLWPTFFPDSPLTLDALPIFDGRIVQYALESEIKDYVRWRQVDTHINNLYNTCYWALIQQGEMKVQDAHEHLSGTVSSQKNELLYSRFGINYNEIDISFRKGNLLVWGEIEVPIRGQSAEEGAAVRTRTKKRVLLVHDDVIKDEWWETGRGKGILD